MDQNIKMKNRLIILTILIFGILFLTEVVNSQEQEALYCAEKTTYGAWCQNVPFNEVDTNYRYDRTSCESTSYCSAGTCVNTATGECLPGPEATCNPEEGGFFYDKPKDEVSQCQIGCCLLGDGASLVERVKCDALGRDYNVISEFRADIQDEPTCLSLASPQEKGACVFETDRGRECKVITKEKCRDLGGGFHGGFLCTAPELGTICAITKRTTCGDNGKVYFVDSCGNLANVYDANEVENIDYWSFIKDPSESCGVDSPNGNAGSPDCGNCDYYLGSTCGPKKVGESVEYGSYICKDLKCTTGIFAERFKEERGRYPEHGEEWCSEPIESFENAKPGQISYLLYCYNGEVQYELCNAWRNKLCVEDRNTGSASCVVNRWQECFYQNNTNDCLDENARDCRIVEGAGLLRTEYGTEKLLLDSNTGEMINAACVPKYTPGFKFWNPQETIRDIPGEETPTSVCEFSNVICFVPYTQEIAGITKWRAGATDRCVDICKETEGWSSAKCYDKCTPICLSKTVKAKEGKGFDVDINKKWAQGWQNLCVSIGDCGVKSNFLGKEGYNRWRDLFIGKKIDWSTLPNANSKE